MTVNLKKGENVDLTKEAGGTLTKLRVALGWEPNKTDGKPFDLDASIVGCGENGLSAGKDWFVFYNNLTSPDGAITHQGDERTGDTAGDDEQIVIDLTKLPATIDALVVAVTIHEAVARGGQNFGQVNNAYVRVIDESTGTELARYDLTEDSSGVNTLIFGKAYRKDSSWKFKALGDSGFANELQGIIDEFKVA